MASGPGLQIDSDGARTLRFSTVRLRESLPEGNNAPDPEP